MVMSHFFAGAEMMTFLDRPANMLRGLFGVREPAGRFDSRSVRPPTSSRAAPGLCKRIPLIFFPPTVMLSASDVTGHARAAPTRNEYSDKMANQKK